MQMRPDDASSMDAYLRKSYFKTASLLANGARAAVELQIGDGEYADAAFAYGSALGMTFQIVDDLLDCVGDSSELGKVRPWAVSLPSPRLVFFVSVSGVDAGIV